MAHVGGVFLASRDPQRLIGWLEDRLAWRMQRNGDGAYLQFGEGAVSVVGVMPATDAAPAPPPGEVTAEPYGRQPMMCNLAVDDLDAVMARLREAGDAVEGPREYEGMGRFAWTRTPDGHDVELWEPA